MYIDVGGCADTVFAMSHSHNQILDIKKSRKTV